MNEIVTVAVEELARDFGCRSVFMRLDEGGRSTTLGISGEEAVEPDDTITVVDGGATVVIKIAFANGVPPELRREARIFAQSAANTFASLRFDYEDKRPRSERILIIDDDDGIRTLVRHVLQREGADVIEAPNGLIGHARAMEFHPDLIVIDWMMPVLDGRAAVVRLKADPFTADIPIVMLSSRSQPDDQQAARMAGVSDVLAKPFTPAALIAAVERHRRPKEAERRAS